MLPVWFQVGSNVTAHLLGVQSKFTDKLNLTKRVHTHAEEWYRHVCTTSTRLHWRDCQLEIVQTVILWPSVSEGLKAGSCHSPLDKSKFFFEYYGPLVRCLMDLLYNGSFVHNDVTTTISRKENEFYLDQIKYKLLWCHQVLCIKTSFNFKKSSRKYSFTDTWCTWYPMTTKGHALMILILW